MDLDQLERLFWWGAGICFLIVAVLIVGEVRGWWNDASEVGLTIAGLVGSLLAAIVLLINATKGQVRNVATGVTDNGRRLGLIHEGVRTLHDDMGTLHDDMGTIHQDMSGLRQGQEQQTEVLVEIRDRL